MSDRETITHTIIDVIDSQLEEIEADGRDHLYIVKEGDSLEIHLYGDKDGSLILESTVPWAEFIHLWRSGAGDGDAINKCENNFDNVYRTGKGKGIASTVSSVDVDDLGNAIRTGAGKSE